MAVNQELPIYRVLTMDKCRAIFGIANFRHLFNILAAWPFPRALGNYGVMAYSVRQRTRNRSANGARAQTGVSYAVTARVALS